MRQIIEKEDVYLGFNYFIKLFEDGHRCGYVKVPANHKFYDLAYDDIPIECHGGLTFSERLEDDSFWIGFDCAHYGDKLDVSAASANWPDSNFTNIFSYLDFDGEIRTLEYVENECKNIIEQLNNERN